MTKVANKSDVVKSTNDADTLKRTVNAENNNEKLSKDTGKGTVKGEKKAEKKPEVKKEKKVRAESNEHIGERLLKEKANEATILATFTKVYKDKKGITDKKFVQARANIYMTIAKKRQEAKAETVKKEVKKAKAA
jgi:hypothetical protein